MNVIRIVILGFWLGLSMVSGAQETQDTTAVKDYTSDQWYFSDPSKDKIPGISLQLAYQHLANRKGERVLVAILDSGFDTAHADIKSNLWVNPREIAGNQIDDDGNGFIDDIHGWNFLGNLNGDVIAGETLEKTRIYRKLHPIYGNMNAGSVPEANKEEYAHYLAVKASYQKNFDEVQQEMKHLQRMQENLRNAIAILNHHLRTDEYTLTDVTAIKSNDDRINRAKSFYILMTLMQYTPESLQSMIDGQKSTLNTKLNIHHNPRHVTGDNPTDIHDTIYGNHNLDGGTAGHGTSVGGLVGAIRSNGFGIDGIAPEVDLMIVRIVPGGDEYDKDVALGIRYAVNQGARVINCSFGKEYSPDKWMVDEAVRYAEAHGVLIIHAAGNDAADNDAGNNFPNPYYADGSRATNWVEVGASTRHPDKRLVASFSNYGQTRVDLFAPGLDIMTLKPGGYGSSSGTSLAAPVVTGVAALLLSYFPDLTPAEVREILMKSVTPYPKKKVIHPSTGKKVRMGKLCVSGGVLNAYKAVLLAELRMNNEE
jgi:subtilisin family serine protease